MVAEGARRGRSRSEARGRSRRAAEPLTASWRPTEDDVVDAIDGDFGDDGDGFGGAGDFGDADDLAAEPSHRRPPRDRRRRGSRSGSRGGGRSGSRGKGGRRQGIARYGWGIYAVPLLVVVTALAFFQVSDPPSTGSSGASSGSSQQAGEPLVREAPPGVKFPSNMFSATLPPGGQIPENGSGTFDVLAGTSPVVGSGHLMRYTVEVESGVQLDGGNDSFGQLVQNTLSDPRSWTNPQAKTEDSPLALQRVDNSGPKPDFRVTLVSQQSARKICGYDNGLPYDTSCKKGDRTYINAARWIRGAVAFESDMLAYRHYAINHEVGHVFGLKHVPCPAQGALAPTMMQQTFSVSNNELHDLNARASQGTPIPKNGFVCRPSAWPFPHGMS